jgi:hypothetical protein
MQLNSREGPERVEMVMTIDVDPAVGITDAQVNQSPYFSLCLNQDKKSGKHVLRDIQDIAPITREKFVEIIFIIHHDYAASLEAATYAVVMGDRFVNDFQPQPETPGFPQKFSGQSVSTASQAVYSEELASVCMALAGKYYDSPFSAIMEAELFCNNGIVFKLELEILRFCNFELRMNTFMDFLGGVAAQAKLDHLSAVLSVNKTGRDWTAPTVDLVKRCCLHQDLLELQAEKLGLVVLALLGKKR